MIPSVRETFSEICEPQDLTAYNCQVSKKSGEVQIESETLGCAIFPVEGDCFLLEMDVHVNEAAEFGIAMHTDPGMEKVISCVWIFRKNRWPGICGPEQKQENISGR